MVIEASEPSSTIPLLPSFHRGLPSTCDAQMYLSSCFVYSRYISPIPETYDSVKPPRCPHSIHPEDWMCCELVHRTSPTTPTVAPIHYGKELRNSPLHEITPIFTVAATTNIASIHSLEIQAGCGKTSPTPSWALAYATFADFGKQTIKKYQHMNFGEVILRWGDDHGRFCRDPCLQFPIQSLAQFANRIVGAKI